LHTQIKLKCIAHHNWRATPKKLNKQNGCKANPLSNPIATLKYPSYESIRTKTKTN
jgi:hypothetical protein